MKALAKSSAPDKQRVTINLDQRIRERAQQLMTAQCVTNFLGYVADLIRQEWDRRQAASAGLPEPVRVVRRDPVDVLRAALAELESTPAEPTPLSPMAHELVTRAAQTVTKTPRAH